MFAYGLMNLPKAAKIQESQTTLKIQKGSIIIRRMHRFHYQQGMLFVGANIFNTGGLKRTANRLMGINNYITVSG